MSDTPFGGGLLAAKSKRKRGLTKGYFLEAVKSKEPKSSRGVLSDLYPEKMVFSCVADTTLSERPVFRVRSGAQSQKTSLRRLANTNLWAPKTVPTLERTHVAHQHVGDHISGHRENLFYLRDLPSGAATEPVRAYSTDQAISWL